MNQITRRTFVAQSAAALVATGNIAHAATPARKPNILWITCEDMSPHLGCYGDAYANTSNLDRLATEGQRYTRAFSTAGVCAPSRSCLITGMYQTTLGTCHMRSNHAPPAHIKCFPTYLREAGYYCTNNVKTDYQFDVPPDAWDDNSKTAHWRNRKNPDQPFFAVFNSTVTHESQIGNLNSLSEALASRIPGGLHDPARATLPPWYPDTELIRKHWAHMYDCHSAMDVWVGDLLKQLEDDGLADNTVVFFFSDHGDGIPRAKRWMYDTGLHVPFIVRWPEELEPNTTTDRMVSFVDFAPTVLSIAGVKIPNHMQGSAFLGKHESKPRKHIFAARDRMDERYDTIRAARDRRFKYIRNYRPDVPYDQYVSYCESWPIMQELRRVHDAGGLNDVQRLFFRSTKPLEELYDTESDPHELYNLAESPEYSDPLASLRAALDRWLDESNDLGFVPETELDRFVPAQNPDLTASRRTSYSMNESGDSVFGLSHRILLKDLNGSNRLRRYRAIKTLGLADGPEIEVLLVAALNDNDVCVASLAATALGNTKKQDAKISEALRGALQHTSPAIKLAAAQSLVRLGNKEVALPVAMQSMKDPDIFVRLASAQILEMIEPKTEEIRDLLIHAKDDKSDPRDYVADVARHALGLPPQH